MAQNRYSGLTVGLLAAVCVLAGCVERRLTIVTEPTEAVVWLNDEEVGTTPVTVGFNWYGDYNVRIEKSGYAILNTHRDLERPLHDRFPFDFFAQVLWPKQIVDEYTWEFELQPYQQASPEELIQAAREMQQRADQQLGVIADDLLNEKDK
ncbi:MAG: PEGA domain-containing protein [Chitinivibrionales bacterium]|nr:PEGA domain-containing protein [Chitinivibrionales bacterium]